jgi:hypothetical protein
VSIYNNTINSTSNSTDISIGNSQISGVLNVGTNASRTGTINIGFNGCTINLGGYLRPSYTSLPPSDAIGATIKTNITDTDVTNVWKLIGAQQTVPAGVWLLIGSVTVPIAGGIFYVLTINTEANPNSDAVSSTTGNTIVSYMQVTHIVSGTTSSTWGLYVKSTSSTIRQITAARLQMIRIA